MKGVLIAGTNSGCGKTTITVGLMGLLKKKGYKVAPFKTGPDYIDPMFHAKVLGSSSYNLDSWMLPPENVQYLFNKHSRGNDISIIEGVMGMYDGKGEEGFGSSYELAQTLDLPVVLVVNCKGLYQSVAAIINGYANLKPNANVKGVILNQASKGVFTFLNPFIEKECGVKCIGYLAPDPEIGLESRHLGLVQAEEVEGLDAKVDRLVSTLEETIDVDALLEVATFIEKKVPTFNLDIDLTGLNLGVASDKAFRFYYKDNLELLEELGASLHYFSPLNDGSIPDACDALYIGGGYPEVFAKELSANKSMLQSIKEVADGGMPIFGECGGLMYLTSGINNLENEFHAMTGVFNCTTQMTSGLKRFGYANIMFNGAMGKCHEFHRSELVENDNINYKYAYQLQKSESSKSWKCGLSYKNVLAGYAHIHFYSNLEFFKEIVQLWMQKTI